MSRYPNADYMRSEQLSQVVLNNGFALKGKNFVSDEVILFDGESQIFDEDKCSDPHWGIKGSEESFRRRQWCGWLSCDSNCIQGQEAKERFRQARFKLHISMARQISG